MENGPSQRLHAGARVSPGDPLYLEIQTSAPAYVYVLNEDDGTISVLVEGKAASVKELTEKRYPGSVSWIVPVDQLKVGVCYQGHRTRCQIIIRIQDPTQLTELHESVADRIGGRRERWQITKHPTKISGHRYIRRPFSMLRAFS